MALGQYKKKALGKVKAKVKKVKAKAKNNLARGKQKSNLSKAMDHLMGKSSW